MELISSNQGFNLVTFADFPEHVKGKKSRGQANLNKITIKSRESTNQTN
jgi:hypothetical protein